MGQEPQNQHKLLQQNHQQQHKQKRQLPKEEIRRRFYTSSCRMVCPKTKRVLGIFDNFSHAARVTLFNRSTIGRACRAGGGLVEGNYLCYDGAGAEYHNAVTGFKNFSSFAYDDVDDDDDDEKVGEREHYGAMEGEGKELREEDRDRDEGRDKYGEADGDGSERGNGERYEDEDEEDDRNRNKDRNRYIERKRIRNRNGYGDKKIDKCEA